MTLEWEGEAEDRRAAQRAQRELEALLAGAVGEPMRIGNEFSEVEIRVVNTRNGVRLLVQAPKSGQWVTLDPLELESLTWQSSETFSAMVGSPYEPLVFEGRS